MNALSDFWGKITGNEQPKITESRAPLLSGYPSQADAKYALEQGFGYGSGNEPYIEARRARVMGNSDASGNKFRAQSAAGLMLDAALSAVDDDKLGRMLDLDKMENWKLKEKLGTTFTQAALAANRNPIAALGFDPSRTVMDLVLKGANIGGAYEAKRDAIYANVDATDPSSVLHESIHRGLEKLRQSSPRAKELINRLPDEESVVRWMMYKYAGDPEKGIGDASDKQREKAIRYFDEEKADWTGARQKALNELMELAANMRKDRRPRGPN